MISRKLILPLSLLLGLMFCGQLAAEGNQSTIGKFLQEGQYTQWRQLENLADQEMLFADDFNDFPMFDEDMYKIKHHSTGRAFLYSLILPGAGEFYTGSKLKAALFLGIEIFSWYQYATKYSDGQDLEDEYRAFANQYWSPGDYRSYLVDEYGISSDTLPYDSLGTPKNFTHHLPSRMNQQYYEMIGKYDQFLYGWADTDYRTGKSTSPYRDKYLKLRDDSNGKFDAAKNYAIISIANRIVSAFDAALSAHRQNKRTDRFSEVRLKARLADYHGETIPRITLTYKFF